LMSDSAHAGSPHSHWRAGDRSRREDDRYLFLEALLSARQQLYISWQGRRTNDHEIKPPSVLVAQLMDYLNTVWSHPSDTAKLAFDAPLQPLQAFSPKYFTPSSGFVTYADDWQRALHTASTRSTPTSQATATPPTELTLVQLQRLLKQPVEVFLVDHLRLRLDQPEAAAEEDEPFALDGLRKYQLNQRITLADDAQDAIAPLRLSGQLALSGFGQLQQQQFERDRQTLRQQLDALLSAWPNTLDVQSHTWVWGDTRLSAEWANGATLWRTDAAHQQWLQVGLRPGAVTEGKKDKQMPRLDTLSSVWLHHLAACASGTPTTSVQIGLDAAVKFRPLTPEQAQAHLHQLCSLYIQAWQAPLPVAAKTACAYLVGLQSGHKDPVGKAQATFEGSYQRGGEYPNSPALQRVFEGFHQVAEALPEWADHLYQPLLNAARVIHLSADKAEEADA
jgi:exodeoxyribonuclease V gamma subunit